MTQKDMDAAVNAWAKSQGSFSQTKNLLDNLLLQMVQSENEDKNKIVDLITRKQYKELESFINENPQDLNDRKGSKINVLTYAMKKADLQAMKILISSGADVNYIDPTIDNNIDSHPIISNSTLVSPIILKYLLESGMKVDNEVGGHCLSKTIQNSLLENAGLYIQHGAPYEHIDINSITPFIKTALMPHIEKREIEKEKKNLEQNVNTHNTPNSKLKL